MATAEEIKQYAALWRRFDALALRHQNRVLHRFLGIVPVGPENRRRSLFKLLYNSKTSDQVREAVEAIEREEGAA